MTLPKRTTEERKELVGIVGHDALDAEPDEALHVALVVDGPDLDAKVEVSGELEKAHRQNVSIAEVLRHLKRQRGTAVEASELQAVELVEPEPFPEGRARRYLVARISERDHGFVPERSDQGALGNAVLSQEPAESPGLLGGEALHFEDEARVVARQHLGEARDAQALASKAAAGPWRLETIAGVELFQLREGELTHPSFAVGRPVHGLVVHDDEVSVRRDAKIHFEDVGAQSVCAVEGVERVLGPEAAPALVGNRPRLGRGVRGVEERVLADGRRRVHERQVQIERSQKANQPAEPAQKTHRGILA